MPPTLLEVQHAVSRALRADKAAAFDPLLADLILADGIAPAARLEIYRNTFRSAATQALRLSHPAVERLVGADFFTAAAHFFIAQVPPAQADLDHYGAGFADFLAHFAPARDLLYLAGVARLEWAVSRALHAADAAPLDPARLATLAPEELEEFHFRPHPALALIATPHPVDEIWRAVLAEDEGAMAAIDLAAGPVWLLVRRDQGGVAVSRLDEEAWRLLAELAGGRTFPDALAAVPEAAPDAATILAALLAAGCFADAAGADITDPEPERPS